MSWIARIFGLYTKSDIAIERMNTATQKREYYQKVIDELHRNGTIPPQCDLKMPKQILRLVNAEDPNDIVAADGRWKRLPRDGEIVRVTYQHP